MFTFRKKEYPAFYQRYLDGFKSTWKKKATLDELRYVVVDTETTGLKPRKDRLLSIGAVPIIKRRMHIRESWDCLVRPAEEGNTANSGYRYQKSDVNKESILIHGIRDQDAALGVSEPDAIKRLLEILQDNVIIGHHIGFDISMINEALKRMGLPRLKNRAVDTARLAYRLVHPQYHTFNRPMVDLSLDALCKEYGIVTEDRHTAAGDAFITGYLFLKLLAKLEKKGVRTLGQLLR